MSPSTSDLATEKRSIDTIRTLAMDAVQAANSGHPGTPMALAPVCYALWNHILRFDPDQPHWPARDRFVLSCGHASMLLYAMLHLTGVKQVSPEGKVLDELAVPLSHLKKFRQLHSRCPGHPEHGETTGVETTTGPLGQGIGVSVGMAIAQQWLSARYDRPGFSLFDYNVYALCSDGDLMEGVGAEAASLAGHLKLANLCWIYDDNSITIEGDTSLAFSERVGTRFEGYGWRVLTVADANDVPAIATSLATFLTTRDAPTLIIVKSHIAWGSPNKQDTHGAHGAPLGEEEIRLTKQAYGWPADEKFLVPSEVLADFADHFAARGKRSRSAWDSKLAEYESKFPDLATELRWIRAGELPPGAIEAPPVFPTDPKGLATRVSSGKVLNAVAKKIPWMIGGSADLAPSTMTLLTFEGAESNSAAARGGRNLHFGIREHAMAAAVNGMALSGLRPFGATFFVFTDYMRPSMRLAALMKLPSLFILTHDSIGVGEDGPTHQPVEHLAALRAIPGLITLRPADANEVAECYRVSLSNRNRPVALVLTRQNLPTLDRQKYGSAAGVARGAYVLSEAEGGKPGVILIASGSEIPLCLGAQSKLAAMGVRARVVSMPSWELFDEQDAAYRESVLPSGLSARVAVEAGVIQGWHKYLGGAFTGGGGRFVGMRGFGASAPAGQLFEHFGLTEDRVVAEALAAISAG